MTDYTKTTDFTSKDSLPSGDSGKIIRGAEFGTEFDNIQTAVNSKSNIDNPTFTGTITGNGSGLTNVAAASIDLTVSSDTDADYNVPFMNATGDGGSAKVLQVDDNGLMFNPNSNTLSVNRLKGSNDNLLIQDTSGNTILDIDAGALEIPVNTTITGTTAVTGNITVTGTVDGRDIAADGTKLDTVETNADVTDTANVTAAGALMDSELTSIASVKALNQGVATTDSPTFAGVTANGTVEFDGLSGTGAITVTDILDQDDMSGNSATALATQQSIKAYVDSQVGTVDTLAEVLANGNATGGTDIAFGDNDKAVFGAGSDLQIYHDGSHNFIEGANAGNIYIRNQLDDGDIIIQSDDGLGGVANYVQADGSNGEVRLFHYGSEKLNTTSTGINVTGTATISEDLLLGSNGRLRVGSTGSLATPTIYLDTDPNTGIYFPSTDSIGFVAGGAEKLTVNSTGINVTGTAVADGLTVQTAQGNIAIPTSTSALNFDRAGTSYLRATDATGNFSVITGADNFTTKRMDVLANGDIRFYEDTGTTPKFYWDASTERLGLGTISPSHTLTVNSGTVNVAAKFISTDANSWIQLEDSNTTTPPEFGATGNELTFRTNGSEAMRIDSTGIDVTGTATMDGLTVGNSVAPIVTLEETGVGTFHQVVDSNAFSIRNNSLAVNSLKINSNNSVQFFEDTGTTAKFHWDAADERLGLGTSSPDQELHVSASATPVIRIESRNNNLGVNESIGSLEFEKLDASGGGAGVASSINCLTTDLGGAVALSFQTGSSSGNNVERMRIDSSGNVGIGTDDPEAALTVTPESGNFNATYNSYDGVGLFLRGNGTAGNGNYGPALVFGSADSDGTNQENKHSAISMVQTGADANQTGLAFWVHPTDASTADLEEAMRIKSDGSVGIGTSVPTNPLTVSSSGSASYTSSKGIVADYTGSSVTEVVPIGFSWSSSTATQNPYWGMGLVPQNFSAGNADLGFYTTGTEACRIDSSQNLLVGCTDYPNDTVNNAIGFGVASSGETIAAVNGGRAAVFKRATSDGSIVEFWKDTSQVGAIGAVSGDLAIFSSAANHKGLRFGAGFVAPTTNSTTVQDATTDLGVSTARFRNLYLSGGVVFGATGGNVSSKTLDDYEEGTWTPEVVGSSTAGSYSNIARSGTYTKVGNVVTVWMLFYGDSGTGTGSLNITGLPFAAVANRSGISVLQYNSGLDIPTGHNTPCVMTNANATSAQVRCNSDSTGSYAAMGYPTTAGYLRFTLTYETTA